MMDDEILYDGDFLRVRRRQHWEFVERANARAAVVIVAVTAAHELLLVEQQRLPVAQPVIELPAGLVGDVAGAEQESFVCAAARELEEETGYTAGALQQIMAGPPSAGLSSEQIVLFRARDLVKTGPGGGDDSEQITVHKVALEEAHGWLQACQAAGMLVDPKVYAGLYFAAWD